MTIGNKNYWSNKLGLLYVVWCVILFLSISCGDNGVLGGKEDANVTIKYYVGTSSFSSAKISVNGETFCTVSKNSTKSIKVKAGDDLLAEYTNYAIYPYNGINQSRSSVAYDGLTWSIP